MSSLDQPCESQRIGPYAEIMAERQQVPMMRVLSHQNMSVLRVQPFNTYQRNRFFR